jgi:hypothetical protein
MLEFAAIDERGEGAGVAIKYIVFDGYYFRKNHRRLSFNRGPRTKKSILKPALKGASVTPTSPSEARSDHAVGPSAIVRQNPRQCGAPSKVRRTHQ